MANSPEQVEQIFEEAASLALSERDAFLREACRGDAPLREQVEKLLSDHERAGSFLQHPLFRSSALRAAFQHAADEGPSSALTAPLEYPPRFVVGDTLADRFVVLRFIDKGGMGEVYEVEDLQLKGVHLALKVVLPQFAEDPVMQERLKREVLLAREVVHPNLCPIYDIFHVERPEGPLTFLTMRLLGGEILAARLRREGPRPLPEATAIVMQVASGIAGAHEAGILHRDIKASNIMLSGSGEQVFACVTDFGLARPAREDATALTGVGLAGTPSYMAPELFYGEPASKASDIYAFGVVVYQLLTGHLPRRNFDEHGWTCDTADIAIPPQWQALIAGCLRLNPRDRFATLPDAIQILSGRDMLRPPHQLSRRRLIVMGTATGMAAAFAIWQRQTIEFLLEPLPKKRFVALMAWPVGDDPAVVSTILDSIGNRLVRAEAYVKDLLIISFNDIAEQAAPSDSPTAALKALGANLVLAASLHSAQSELSLALRVVDAETQRVLRKAGLSCAQNELSKLTIDGAKAAALLLGLPSREQPLSDQEELSRVSPKVLRSFSDAEQLAHQPNDTGLTPAVLKYQEALAEDPHFAFGYAKLAIDYIHLYLSGADSAGLDLAARNASLALRYNPESATGLFSQALVQMYSGKTEAALDSFARSLRADPGNPETLLYKAQAFRDLSHWQQAEQTYRDILKERPNYWPAWDELGWIRSRQARYKDAEAAYKLASSVAPNVALPVANLATMYLEQGKRDEAMAACDRSLKIAPNEGAYLLLGDMAFTDGKYTAALDNYRRASALMPGDHLVWRNIGDCYAMLGDQAMVKKNYARAAGLVADFVAANPRAGTRWATLAFYDAKLGNRDLAEADIARAKALGVNDVDSRFMFVQALVLLGKKEEALQLLLACIDSGLAPINVDLALDLASLRKDPRYLSHIAKLRSPKTSSPS